MSGKGQARVCKACEALVQILEPTPMVVSSIVCDPSKMWSSMGEPNKCFNTFRQCSKKNNIEVSSVAL